MGCFLIKKWGFSCPLAGPGKDRALWLHGSSHSLTKRNSCFAAVCTGTRCTDLRCCMQAAAAAKSPNLESRELRSQRSRGDVSSPPIHLQPCSPAEMRALAWLWEPQRYWCVLPSARPAAAWVVLDNACARGRLSLGFNFHGELLCN